MVADRAWVKRNLGFDPAAPLARAAMGGKIEDIQREIIDFDSEGPEGKTFLAASTATGLSKFKDIPWPAGLAPKTGSKPSDGTAPLPKADVLVVTWTVDEGHALSKVLTPGKDSRNDYVPYTNNYAAISALMRKGAPALEAKALGAFWTTSIGGKSVVVFKSDSHLSQDGPAHGTGAGYQLPNAMVWKQIIEQVSPKLVITTGTAGGIGTAVEVGDVIVSAVVYGDCKSKFKTAPFAKQYYKSHAADDTHFRKAMDLMKTNADQLPKDNKRPPKIIRVAPTAETKSVVTTDFFGFDTSDDHYKLKDLGDVCEMGDVVMGYVAQAMGAAAPKWLAIRNVSDPQIEAEGSLHDQAAIAAQIYKGFGRWSSVCSAIACWAAIAAL